MRYIVALETQLVKRTMDPSAVSATPLARSEPLQSANSTPHQQPCLCLMSYSPRSINGKCHNDEAKPGHHIASNQPMSHQHPNQEQSPHSEPATSKRRLSCLSTHQAIQRNDIAPNSASK